MLLTIMYSVISTLIYIAQETHMFALVLALIGLWVVWVGVTGRAHNVWNALTTGQFKQMTGN
jgi:hypothetical protein